MTFEDCLSRMLHVLLLLLQIPMDISFQMQIPLTITYCTESSVYRRWHSKQGGVSPLCKEVRASQTLTKVLGGVTHQGSKGMDHPLQTAFSSFYARCFCRFSCSEVCAGLGNGCERFCASRSLLGPYIHQESI